MKKIFFTLFALCQLFYQSNAQGIKFQSGLTWEQIKAKAKIEGKFIFMDAYATWCGPCKEMSANIFSNQSIGRFFNENFICVKVQVDSTGNDDEDTRKWYTQASKFKKELKINTLPSLFFFSSDGVAVDKSVGYKDTIALLTIAKGAMNPLLQYYTTLSDYNQGKRDTSFVKTLAYRALDVGDNEVSFNVAKTFIQQLTEKELADQYNVLFVADFTTDFKDRGFRMLLKNWSAVSKYFSNKNFADERLSDIIRAKYLEPIISGVKKGHKINWDKIETDIIEKFGSIGGRVLLERKAMYHLSEKDIDAFVNTKNEIVQKFPISLSSFTLNNDAWFIFENSMNKANLKSALKWAEKAIKEEPTANYYDTYANIFYKLGMKTTAIKMEEKGLQLPAGNGSISDAKANLEKMKKGLATWLIVK